MPHALLRPYECTWEDWLLGGGALASFDDPAQPLEVEIGPGDDEFLLRSALRHPGHNWLGIEYSHKRVRRYVRRIQREGNPPGNLRLIWRPAADLVAPFLSPARVTAYHVYFPDPWPKAHHARYRLLAPGFLGDLRASLVPGGRIFLATDAQAYACEILAAIDEVPGLSSALPPPGIRRAPPQERRTVFEERWRAEGREILALELVRDPD